MKSYRLLKDVPKYKAGTIYKPLEGNRFYPEDCFQKDGTLIHDRMSIFGLTFHEVNDPEWFEEIIEHTDLHLVAGKPYEYYLELLIEKMHVLGVNMPSVTPISVNSFCRLWDLAKCKGITLADIPDKIIYTEDDLRKTFRASRVYKTDFTNHIDFMYENFEDYLNQIKKQ